MTLVETKSLDSLDSNKLSNKLSAVRDYALRDNLIALWELVKAENAGKSEGVVCQCFVERAWEELHVRRVRVLTRLSEDSLAFIRDEAGRIYKAYKTDGNAYMDIWLLPNGQTTGHTVSRFDAHQPDYRSKVEVEYPTAKKLMRLHVNDMIAIGEGSERRVLRVQQLSGQNITAIDHTAAGQARELSDLSRYRKSAGQVLQAGLRKVSVDVLGRVQDGGSFDPDGRGKNGRQ